MPHTAASIVTYSILNQCEVASNMCRYSGIIYGHRSASVASTDQLIIDCRKEGFGPVVRARILAGNYFLLKRFVSQSSTFYNVFIFLMMNGLFQKLREVFRTSDENT